jgi:hypothetical protein
MGGHQRDDELVQALELAVQELRAPPGQPPSADGVDSPDSPSGVVKVLAVPAALDLVRGMSAR